MNSATIQLHSAVSANPLPRNAISSIIDRGRSKSKNAVVQRGHSREMSCVFAYQLHQFGRITVVLPCSDSSFFAAFFPEFLCFAFKE
jgi:hypothetical protein